MSSAWAKKNNITSSSPYEEKLKALKGMTLAVSSIGGGASQLVTFLAKQAKLDLDPVSGARLQEVIQEMLATPKAVVDRLAEALVEDRDVVKNLQPAGAPKE